MRSSRLYGAGAEVSAAASGVGFDTDRLLQWKTSGRRCSHPRPGVVTLQLHTNILRRYTANVNSPVVIAVIRRCRETQCAHVRFNLYTYWLQRSALWRYGTQERFATIGFLAGILPSGPGVRAGTTIPIDRKLAPRAPITLSPSLARDATYGQTWHSRSSSLIVTKGPENKLYGAKTATTASTVDAAEPLARSACGGWSCPAAGIDGALPGASACRAASAGLSGRL